MKLNRDLAVVVWHEDSHEVQLTYFEGAPDQLICSESVAKALARAAGLSAVPTTDGTRRWARRAMGRAS